MQQLWRNGLGLIVVGVVWLGSTGCAHRVLVQPVVDVAKYNRVAILPFETDSFLSTVGNQVADEVVVNLLKHAPAMDVVERTRIDALLREQNLSRERVVNPESAIAVGKLLGVRAIMTGSISVSVGDIQPTPANAQRVATGSATARLIDTETGKVLWGGREESSYSTFLGTSAGTGALNVKTDQEMVQYVITDLGRQLAEAFYPHTELQY